MDNTKAIYKNKIKNRIFEIDLLRGIAVLFMIFDHIFYDLWDVLPMFFSDYPKKGTIPMDLFSYSRLYWSWDVRIFVRYIIVFIFLGLVGLCASFSKRNIKRGLGLMGISLILTFVSLIVAVFSENLTMLITFGTLHCISLSLLAIGALEKFVKNKWIYLIVGIIMMSFGAYFEMNSYTVFFKEGQYLNIIFKQILGMVDAGGDTMGFLLNGGQVFVGYFLGKLLYSERKSLFNKKYKDNVILVAGRNSLIIYFLHQILLPIALSFILLMFGYTLNF